MNLDQTTRWRSWIGKVAAVFCVAFFLASFDGLIALFRHPVTTIEVLPGQVVPVDGALKENVQDIGNLTYVSDSDKLRLSFESVHTGFWAGGYMWRGLLTVSPRMEPGEYRLAVDHRENTSRKPTSVFQIKVYKDYRKLRENSMSLFRRYLDVSPWLVFAAFFVFTCLTFGGVFLLSHRRDSLLAEQGKAEIYRISRTSSGCEIAFGLGTRHGVQAGVQLNLLDRNGNPVGQARVIEAYETDALAIVESTSEVEQGFMVERP